MSHYKKSWMIIYVLKYICNINKFVQQINKFVPPIAAALRIIEIGIKIYVTFNQ